MINVLLITSLIKNGGCVFLVRLDVIFSCQIHGVAMGSPLAPAFANIFIVFYEKWLNEYNLNKPQYYFIFL